MTEWQKEWQIERKGELSDMERKEWKEQWKVGRERKECRGGD